MSELLVEVVPTEKKEEAKVLVEVDEVPCEAKDTECNRRWLQAQSDCV